MLKNYIKIAWRNLFRNKAYSAINIGGLAIGIAACLLILQYVSFETSYEDFHDKKDRIYRVKQSGTMPENWKPNGPGVRLPSEIPLRKAFPK